MHLCTLFLCVYGTWVSRGLVACLLVLQCTELTQLYSFFGFPSLHTLRQNKRGMHIERTITLKYYIYKFINYEQKYIHECYLAEPGVSVFLSHTSIIYLPSCRCGALSLLCLYTGQDTQEQELGTVSACQEQAESLRAPTYIIK